MKFVTVCLLLSFKLAIFAQNWQNKSEKLYRYVGGDSLIVSQKEQQLDTEGRLIKQRIYYYNTVPPLNSLYREESSDWNEPVMTQRTVTYAPNKSPNSEKLEIYYKKYHPKDDSCQVAWARKYDAKGELNKEDTFTYNKKNLLVKKCSYDYQGSTSLLCETYKYNSKGQCKRYRSHVHWTTINIRGRASNKKTLRIDYKYKYKKNKIVSIKGRNYSSDYQVINKYDKAGNLTFSETTVNRTHKTSAADRAKNDSLPKKQISQDKKTLKYENGRLTEETIIENNIVRKKLLNKYQDSLLVSTQIFGKNEQRQEEKDFLYENGVLKSRTTRRYNDRQLLNYTVLATCNEYGKIVSEVQTMNEKIVSTILQEYDTKQNLIETTLLNTKGDKIEKTIYKYSY